MIQTFSHVIWNSLCFCVLYISVQFDLCRKSLIELTAEAPAVTRSRCVLTGKRVRLVMWGALGVLGRDVGRQCASKPQLE